jgi:short-subunit dehydrogenase
VYFSSGMDSFLPSPYNSVNAGASCYVQKLTESLRYEYSDKNLHFQCLSPFFFKTKSGLNKTNDWLKYSQHSIKTLGYSTNTYGDWFMGLQVMWSFFKLKIIIFNFNSNI